MKIYVSGGCKNGKSMFAQKLAQNMSLDQGVPLYYVATMRPVDDEDLARIARHIKEREGWGFTTIEQSQDIDRILEAEGVEPGGSFLLDSVTALLSNEMFGTDGSFNPQAGQKVAEDLCRLAEKTENLVFVSDYIYGDGPFFDEYTECYRRGLAYIDRQVAKRCQRVMEVSYGQIVDYK